MAVIGQATVEDGLYEVSRGGLGQFTVELPPGLAVEQVGTDEGDVVPAVEARRLTVHRRKQLQGVGYLVLTSTPAPGAEVPLAPVVPDTPVQARYTALSSSVAAEVRPLPEVAWSRVDLDDLPPSLRDALGGVDLAAAWRLSGASEGLAMAVSPLPAAPALAVVVSARETTTLLTLDGTLLHRDRFTLRPGALGTALDVELPASATLWSAKVDDLPVRPLERGGGRISVPLGFDAGKDSVVEVISVLEKAIPPGRSQLALDLPRISAPVLRHSLRLLLPDGNRYRFRAGDLRPAAVSAARQGAREIDGVEITDVAAVAISEEIAVTAETPMLDERQRRKPATAPAAPGYHDFDAFEELQKGLVGGVKPLPIAIPESGKLLLLTGVLPPAEVRVELEVKAGRR